MKTGGNVSIFGCVGWNEVTLLKFKDCICSGGVVIITVCDMSQQVNMTGNIHINSRLKCIRIIINAMEKQ